MNERLLACAEKAGLLEKFQKSVATTSLQDIGLDSLDLYALVMEIQDEIGREISDDELAGVAIVSDLENFFS